MTKGLCASDYEKLYEDGLYQHERAVEALTAAVSEGQEDEQGSSPVQAATRVLTTRAHLDGILQEQARSTRDDRRVCEAAEALRRTWRINEAKSQTMGAELSIWGRNRQSSSSSNKGTRNNVASMFCGTVDEFFETYPETMRPDNDDDDDESSSSDDEEEEVNKPTARPPPCKKRSDPQGQQQQEVIDVDTVPMQTQLPPSGTPGQQQQQASMPQPPPQARQAAAVNNPYARNSSAAAPQPPNIRPSSSSSSSQRRGQINMAFSYTPVDNTDESVPGEAPRHDTAHMDHAAAWEDYQRQNPFQTAREFSKVESSRQNTVREHAASSRRHHHPASHHGPAEPPRRHAIPDSLKRKFQPPGKKASTKATTTQQQPPSSKSGVTQKQQNAKRNDEGGEDDEDELPEELKRFGKELVQKIENEIMDGGEPITFEDIAGLHDAKQTIQEVICWPMKRPDLFTGLRRAPNGLLLYGPPGTGKTLIGKAIAHESGATFFSISSSSLTSKWIGEGEKLVRTMFAVAAYREPSVVFIDEIDSLLTQRKSDDNEASRRIKTEFLVQLDGTGTTAQGRVLTIGATNRPQELDEAARRRFVKRLYIPLPSEADRGTLLRVLLEKNNHRLTEADVTKLAKETAGYSGADLKSLCTDAAMGPIRMLGSKALEVQAADVPPISYKHFRQSLRSMKPSVASADLVQYEEWDKIYGSKRVEEDATDDSSSDED